ERNAREKRCAACTIQLTWPADASQDRHPPAPDRDSLPLVALPGFSAAWIHDVSLLRPDSTGRPDGAGFPSPPDFSYLSCAVGDAPLAAACDRIVCDRGADTPRSYAQGGGFQEFRAGSCVLHHGRVHSGDGVAEVRPFDP